MSLLTNEQINDILDITNVCESSIVVNKLNEWNEKQTGTQINVNWDDAPDHAKIASIRIHWLTEINAGWSTTTEIISFDRPIRPIVAHPHAEMIAKYAEVAQRRVDPWVEFEWAFGVSSDYWQNCDKFIGFSTDKHYRHIGELK